MQPGSWLLLAALLLTLAVYWPGLYGGYLFDDYPNIVENHGVQPRDASMPELVRAALSSPSSEFKRPLASLSFAANYLTTGLDPYWMKLTNLVIHLLNGLLVFILSKALLLSVGRALPASSNAEEMNAERRAMPALRSGTPQRLVVTAETHSAPDASSGRPDTDRPPVGRAMPASSNPEAMDAERRAVPALRSGTPQRLVVTAETHSAPDASSGRPDTDRPPVGRAMPASSNPEAMDAERRAMPALRSGTPQRLGVVAALIAAGWLLLPINLTGVLYVVQRMESMANLFVLLGLIGYVAGRRRMLGWLPAYDAEPAQQAAGKRSGYAAGFIGCAVSITVLTVLGIMAKETAVMLPLYALLVEWVLFDFAQRNGGRDRRIIALFLLVLVLPMALGLAWLLPGVFNPEAWATRDFTLRTRLLSEARIVSDYVRWTLLPTPHALSFYHDDFRISTGLLTPWTTLVSIAFLAGLTGVMLWARRRLPLVALGIALFLGCQLLTGTVLPLELIYEHRNYFASFGLMLAVIPLLAAPSKRPLGNLPYASGTSVQAQPDSDIALPLALPLALPRYALLAGLMVCWAGLTAMTAYAWGNPLRLAQDLAARAPQSPRAEYELGRTYIVYSHYDPASPFTRLAYAPLERAMRLPDASILPEQALIFMNARMQLPIKDAWWDSLIGKLKARKSTVQDESSLGALTECARTGKCNLPKQRMMDAYYAALSHPDPSARLLAMYGDYAWNVLDDHTLGLRMTEDAVKASPSEPAYQITLIRMLAVLGRTAEAEKAIGQLATLNYGGRLDSSLAELHKLPGLQ